MLRLSRGCTTRKDGHGFGLYGAGLASKEMGGELSVASTGLGQGATFMLELPLRMLQQVPEIAPPLAVNA